MLHNIDNIKHKEGCIPALRRTELISPIIGFRCSNCRAEKITKTINKETLLTVFERHIAKMLTKETIHNIIDEVFNNEFKK
jgi:hypothetical protein